jgi:hypothetical protein
MSKKSAKDYQDFLDKWEITEEDVQKVTHAVPFIPTDGDIEIKPSDIEGRGLFVTRPHKTNEIIAPAVINGQKTQAGRFSNHSSDPNAKMVVKDSNNIDIVAIKDIEDQEITTDYNENIRSQAVIRAREDILNLEAAILEAGGTRDGDDIAPVTNYFAPGVNARSMFIPKDTLLTGAIHTTEHLNILAQGKVSVSNQGESITMQAPYTFVSPVGTKRAIYAHEDSTWITIHATDLTDEDEIKAMLVADSFEELDAILERTELKRIEK